MSTTNNTAIEKPTALVRNIFLMRIFFEKTLYDVRFLFIWESFVMSSRIIAGHS